MDNNSLDNNSLHNTIFDDVYHTMVQKMPQLLIPVINEAFHTSYTEQDDFEQLRNEHEEQFGKVITDSIIKIGKKLYHIECQSTPDSTMVIRMIEYDFAIALEQTLLNGKPYEMNFPQSCVLYLRHSRRTPDIMEIKVNLPDEESFYYRVPIIKVQQYTKDVIFQKNLLFFLPYYIMRYEKQLPEIYKNHSKLNALLREYNDIRCKLEIELYDEGKSILYSDLIKLIITISDYIVKSEDVKERIGATMGGKVLELESERQARILKENIEKYSAEARAIALVEGHAEGHAIASLQGLQAMVNTLKNICNSTDEICKHIWSNEIYAEVTREEIENIIGH